MWELAQGARPVDTGAASKFPSPSSGHIRFQNMLRLVLLICTVLLAHPTAKVVPLKNKQPQSKQ